MPDPKTPKRRMPAAQYVPTADPGFSGPVVSHPRFLAPEQPAGEDRGANPQVLADVTVSTAGVELTAESMAAALARSWSDERTTEWLRSRAPAGEIPRAPPGPPRPHEGDPVDYYSAQGDRMPLGTKCQAAVIVVHNAETVDLLVTAEGRTFKAISVKRQATKPGRSWWTPR